MVSIRAWEVSVLLKLSYRMDVKGKGIPRRSKENCL